MADIHLELLPKATNGGGQPPRASNRASIG